MKAPATEHIAGWSARHRKIAVFGWLLLVVVVFVVGQRFSSTSAQGYDAGQSGQAERSLDRLTATSATPSAEVVLIKGGDAAQRNAAASAVETALGRLPGSAADVRLAGTNTTSTLVGFTINGTDNAQSAAVTRDRAAVAAVQARYPGLTVAETGDASLRQALGNSLDSDFRRAEFTTVPIALVLLLLVFGALIAAGIPLLLAICSVAVAISLLGALGRWLPVTSATTEVVLIIGMAVGVDYTLFYLRREREERARGASSLEAVRTAARTSGRAVLVSGITVMIALAGLILTGSDEFTGIAVGSIVVVGITVLGSLTALPALLAWLGPKADRGKIPFLGRRRAAAKPSRAWAAIVRQVVRRPLAFGGIAAIALLALAAPALGMRLGQPAIDAPASLPAVRTMEMVDASFGAPSSPAEVVITGTGVTNPTMTTELAALKGRAAGTTVARVNGGLIAYVPIAGNGEDSKSVAALTTLRQTTLPDTIGRVPGVNWAVTGDTAQIHDDIQQLDSRLPLVFGVVGVLAFGVLILAFRSMRIALVSIVLNLLSVGAAYGVITLIFQDGRLQGALDYVGFGGIIWWVPLFMFVFLFGISMDYHVFVLSRIRERRSITEGIASSAGVVTSAALIMVAVFSVFATMGLVDLKMLGVGTAVAVLIDATVVRGVLLPAALALTRPKTIAPAPAAATVREQIGHPSLRLLVGRQQPASTWAHTYLPR
jgi:putative drug exporter of the RND superfamily